MWWFQAKEAAASDNPRRGDNAASPADDASLRTAALQEPLLPKEGETEELIVDTAVLVNNGGKIEEDPVDKEEENATNYPDDTTTSLELVPDNEPHLENFFVFLIHFTGFEQLALTPTQREALDHVFALTCFRSVSYCSSLLFAGVASHVMSCAANLIVVLMTAMASCQKAVIAIMAHPHCHALVARHGWRRIVLGTAAFLHLVCPAKSWIFDSSIHYVEHQWDMLGLVVLSAIILGGKQNKTKEEDHQQGEMEKDSIDYRSQSNSNTCGLDSWLSTFSIYKRGLFVAVVALPFVSGLWDFYWDDMGYMGPYWDYWDYLDFVWDDGHVLGSPSLFLCVPLFLVLFQLFWEAVLVGQESYDEAQQRQGTVSKKEGSSRMLAVRMCSLQSPLGRACGVTFLVVMLLCATSIRVSIGPWFAPVTVGVEHVLMHAHSVGW